MSAAQRARLDAAAAGSYKYMDNATFDLRTAAVAWLDAGDRLATCPEPEYNAASGSEWNAREALYTAFEQAGLDRDLLKRLGLYL
jgi:hypothetical protein